MKIAWRSLIIVSVLFGLLALSLVAAAQHEEGHDEDTLFSFGYDEVNHFLALNLGPNDVAYECDFENGSLAATYGDADAEGVIPVDSLSDSEGTKEFEARSPEELPDGVDAEDGSVPYSGPTGECAVFGVVVSGPNGQINHGQFMKAAKRLFDLKGHGCIVRYLAKSDIGRTDATKLRRSDVDPMFESGDSGDITFATFEADCSRGKSDKDADVEQSKKGRPESPGHSGDAPGKNK